MIAWGEQLRQLRRSRGLSVRGLAAAVLISPGYLSRVERGEFPPPAVETIGKLAVVLDVDSSEMVESSGKATGHYADRLKKRIAELERALADERRWRAGADKRKSLWFAKYLSMRSRAETAEHDSRTAEREAERLFRVVLAAWESEACEDPDCGAAHHGHSTDVFRWIVDLAEEYQAAHPDAPKIDPAASTADNVRTLLDPLS